jgi:D-glycero-D-manno-heptose 1,7-bisphosphate phosphatase
VTPLDTVFLDRDGTLNVKAPEGDYITSWERFEWLPGALEAVRVLTEAGVRLVVVTNQRGIALGRMTEDDLSDIHGRMLDDVAAAGGRIDAVYHCPHEAGTCDCRKPLTGLFERARVEHPGLDFARSAMVGDSLSDMEAARRIGATAIRVVAGGDRDGEVHTEESLLAAARWLIDGPLR